MKFNEITESTTSGSVATVSAPIGGTQSRGQGVYPQKKVGNLLTGKKAKGKFANSLSEAELAEHDLILVPGQGHRLKSGFVPHGKSRLDQEVEMAKSDLYQAAKNAKSVYELIKDRTEDEGLEGWVQEKIIKANDYLNSVREYLEGKQIHEMTGGVIAGGGVGESADFGSYYYEKVAKQVFDQNPNLQSEEAVLVRAFDIVAKDLGMNPTRKLFYYDEDFPSDLVSAYSFLKKQSVAEGDKVNEDPITGAVIGGLTGVAMGLKGAHHAAKHTSPNSKSPLKDYTKNFAKGAFDPRTYIPRKKKGVEEGAKVDRMVKHIAKSEREAGKSKDEAESIAWATANKRGYLDNKNKKKGK